MRLLAVTYEMLATSDTGRSAGPLLADLGSAYAEVQMITGSIETANAATALNDAAIDLEMSIAAREPVAYDARFDAVKTARDVFVAECRRDLDLWIDLPATGVVQATAGVAE